MQHLPRAPIARSSRRRQQEAALPPPTVFETSSLPSNAELPQSPSNSGRDSSLSFDFARISIIQGAVYDAKVFVTIVRSVEARQIELGTSMDELKQLIQNLTQTSFCIKGSIYESHKTVNMTYMDFDIWCSCAATIEIANCKTVL
ncbi:hypothetical protein EMCRGX_G005148 [Ephydatia muelleri]